MDKFDLPLADIICDGGMMNIFRSIGCIGDSLSSGEFILHVSEYSMCMIIREKKATGTAMSIHGESRLNG